MPSPYGEKAGVDQYYRHAVSPRRYVYRWSGMPQGISTEPYYRDVGADPTGPDAGWVETGDSVDFTVRYRKDLSGTWPVALTGRTGKFSVRNSGPEQGKMEDGPRPTLGLPESAGGRLALAGAAVVGAWLLWWRLR